MNILITAGGTTEKIDSVRSISNFSTGKLGSLIAARFAAEPAVDKIFYLCGTAALIPPSEKVEALHAGSVSDLAAAIQQVLAQTSVDIIVHAMAVSDYRVKTVTTAARLADSIVTDLEAAKPLGSEAAASTVVSAIKNAAPAVGGDGKIRSDVDDMLLMMERTPKIIALFQALSPQSTLVGFKLLDHAPLDALIDAGFQVLTQNKCSFVLANDLRDVSSQDAHVGYLIDKEKHYTRYAGKTVIADAIVSATMNERRNRC